MIKLIKKWFFHTWAKKKLLHKWFIVRNLGLVECIQIEEEYLTVKNRKGIFRVFGEDISQILPTPKFRIGDSIYELNKSEVKGVIDDLFWHFKRKQYVYYISINGKRKSKWLYDSDLIAIYD